MVQLKILFMVSDWVGPQNACIGLAQTLRDKRGHQIYFCTTDEFIQKYQNYGFKLNENLLLLEKSSSKQSEEESKNNKSLEYFVEKILSYGFVSSLSPLEKVKKMFELNIIKTTFEDQLIEFDSQLSNHLERIQPNLIIYDGEVIPPAILFWQKCPWIYLFCSNPIGLFDSDDLPPFLSDFPTNSPKDSWQEFRQTLDECYFSLVRQSQANLCEKLNYPPLSTILTHPNYQQQQKDGKMMKRFRFFIHSPYLNLYQYPMELDYNDLIEIPENYFRVDSFCRSESNQDDFDDFLQRIPRKFLEKNHEKKLIYLSMGSMGSCNLELMKRLIKLLDQPEYLVLISKGPLGDQLELPSSSSSSSSTTPMDSNMFGENYLPQISIYKNLSIDLAIIHGGNNTLCESFYYGIPLIIMPLFYDQFLNARRLEEKQLGFYIDPFNFHDEHFLKIVETILISSNNNNNVSNQSSIFDHMKSISLRIQNNQSKLLCCEKLEEIVKDFCN